MRKFYAILLMAIGMLGFSLPVVAQDDPESTDIATGYYYVYANEAQALVNINKMLKWDPLQRGNAAFIFYIEKAGDGEDFAEYWVQSLYDDSWFSCVPNYYITEFRGEDEKARFVFDPIDGGGYGIRPLWDRPDMTKESGNWDHNWMQTTASRSTSFSGTTGDYHPLAQWTKQSWYVEQVPDYELATAKLRVALKKAIVAYQNANQYTVGEEGLITNVESDDPATGYGSQFLSTCQRNEAYSSFANLIDGDLGTCFQATWSAEESSAPQWLQIDASKEVEGFQLKIGLRNSDWGSIGMWQDITLFATNDENAANDLALTTIEDVIADPAWVRIGEYEYSTSLCLAYGEGNWGMTQLKAHPTNTDRWMTKDFLLFGNKYRYLRFFVNQTMNPHSENKDFTLGEVQIYEISNTTVNASISEKVNALKDLIEKTKTMIAEQSGTEADVEALVAAAEAVESTSSQALADLKALIENVEQTAPKFNPGTDPGYNDEEAISAYEKALANANAASHQELSDEEYAAAGEALLKALEDAKNSVIPVTDGYYRIISAYPEFTNKQHVLKAMYANYEGTMAWTTLDEENPSMLFKITSLGDGTYSVQSVGTDTYIGSVAGTSAFVPQTETQQVGQIFKNIAGSTQFNIYNTENDIPYHTNDHNSGNGNAGAIVTWSGGVNSCSAWNIVKVTDEDLINHLINDVAPQNILNYKAAKEVGASQIVYEQMFRYKTNFNRPLINAADDDDPDNNQFRGSEEPSAHGDYSYFHNLIDGNHATCFQSTWSSSVQEPPQWLQVDLRNNPVQNFQFYYGLRNGMWGAVEQWTDITVFATNDESIALDENIKKISEVEELEEWTKIGDYQLPIDLARDDRTGNDRGFYFSINRMDQKYRFIRFYVNSTYEPQANMMYTIGEFQVYENEFDEENSPYAYIPGLSDAADRLQAAIEATQAAVAEGTVTQEIYDEIVAAREAMVALVPNTAPLDQLVENVKEYVNNFAAGDQYGDVSAENWTTMQKAIDDAANYGNHPLKADLEERYTALEEALATFKKQQKQFEPNKWYYIVNRDKSAVGSYVDGLDNSNVYDTFTYGNVVIATSDNTIAAGSWGEGNKNAVHWGYYNRYEADKDKTDGNAVYRELTDPHTMWRFVPIEGQEGQYAIQNRASGKYLVNYTGASNTWVYQVDDPMPYTLENFASGQYGIIPPGATQYLQTAGDGYIYSWSDARKVDQRWAWDLEPIEDEDYEFMNLQFPENSIQVVSLPYALNDEDLSDYNAEVGLIMYGVDGIHTGDDGSQELYLTQKLTVEAGEPFILVAGDYEAYDNDNVTLTTFAIPMINEYTTENGKANGLVAALDYTRVPRAGLGVFVKSELKATTENQGIDAHTGYIDTKNLAEATGNPDLILTLAEGITSVKSLTGAVKANEQVNVYTIDGKLVKKNVKAVDAKKGLKKGIYVVGKQKVAVK